VDPRVESVRAALVAHTPIDERERESLAAVVAHLDGPGDPFDEHAGRRHITGSAVIPGRRGVVLLRHKRTGTWLQPGGHVEAGEHPADAALREAVEETGLPLRHPPGGPVLVHVDVHPGPKAWCEAHLDLRFLLLSADAEPHPPAGESQEVAWFPLPDAFAVADPGFAGALRALVAGPWADMLRPDGA
jgi:8-oxo-dGTP pyrophosphatase MutT (NUDIX family)